MRCLTFGTGAALAACMMALALGSWAETAGIDTVGTTLYPNGGMAEVGVLGEFKHENNARCGIVSPDGTRAWVGLFTEPGIIVEIDLTTMQKIGSLELGALEPGVIDAAIDPAGAFGYFLLDSAPARIVRVDLATFTRSGNIDLLPGEEANCLAMEHAGGYLYVGVDAGGQGRIARIDLALQARKDAISLTTGDLIPVFGAVTMDDTYAYFLNSPSPTRRLIKIRLDDFIREDFLPLEDGIAAFGYEVFGLTLGPDGNYAFISVFLSSPPPPAPPAPPKSLLLRTHLDDFFTIDNLALPLNGLPSNLSLSEAGSEGVIVFSNLTPVLFDLVNFTVGTPGPPLDHLPAVSRTLPIPGMPPSVLVLHETSAALIDRIDFDFNAVSPLVLDGGEADFRAIVQDADGLNCYLASASDTSALVRVDQDTMERTGGVVFDLFGRTPSAATTDGRHAYMGTHQDTRYDSNAVIKVGFEPLAKLAEQHIQTNVSVIDSLAYNPYNDAVYVSSHIFFNPGPAMGYLESNFAAFNLLFNSLPNQRVLNLVTRPVAPDFYYILTPSNIVGLYHGSSGLTDYSPSAFTTPTSLLRNSDTGRLYLATQGPAAKIYDLDPFTLGVYQSFDSSTVPGLSGEDLLHGVIDPRDRFDVYYTEPSAIVKHSIADFQSADLYPISYSAHAMLLDPDGARLFAYGSGRNELHKIQLTPRERMEGTRFELTQSAEVNSVNFLSHAAVGARREDVTPTGYEVTSFRSGFIDRARDRAWFGTGQIPAHILEFDTVSRSVVTSILLESGEDDLTCAAIDPLGNFGYFGTNTFPAKVVKVDLSNTTRVAALPLESDEGYLIAAAIDPAGEFAYFACDTSPARIVKVRLSDFTRVGALTLESNEGNPRGIAIDPQGDHLYVSGTVGFFVSGVVKIQLSDFTHVSGLPTSLQFPAGLGIDPTGEYLYMAGSFIQAGGVDVPGVVERVQLSDFTVSGGPLTLAADEIFPGQVAVDPDGAFLLVGCDGPSKVVKVDLATFSRESAGALRPDLETGISSILVDAAGEFAYLGLNTTPGRIVTFDVSPTPLRLGVFRDFGDYMVLEWQSPPVAVPQDGWLSIPIEQGQKSALELPRGAHLLAWQFDADESGPSYSPGNPGDGIQAPLAFGEFPSILVDGAGSYPDWIDTASRWSAYLDFDPRADARNWSLLE